MSESVSSRALLALPNLGSGALAVAKTSTTTTKKTLT